MSETLWKRLARFAPAARLVPHGFKRWLRRRVSVLAYDLEVWARADPFRNEPPRFSGNGHADVKLGIVKEFAHAHQHYVAACRELGVPYELVDLAASDWVEAVQRVRCDAFLVWPSPVLSIWKQMYEERLKIIQDELGLRLYPSYDEIWLYESKRRMRDWLRAHRVPHPRTEVFYHLREALEFVAACPLPVVLKTNHGASAHGVKILRRREEVVKWVKRAFRKGLVPERGDPRDRQWGHVILQEYLPEVREWRLVRIGDSYFGHVKGKRGEFHSGSGRVVWQAPPEALLEFLRRVTDLGGFTSMNVDVFETRDGRYLVNELQTVFGASYSGHQLEVDGRRGRFRFDAGRKTWRFEPGDFARNHCCNLRVEYLLGTLSRKQEAGASARSRRAVNAGS